MIANVWAFLLNDIVEGADPFPYFDDDSIVPDLDLVCILGCSTFPYSKPQAITKPKASRLSKLAWLQWPCMSPCSFATPLRAPELPEPDLSVDIELPFSTCLMPLRQGCVSTGMPQKAEQKSFDFVQVPCMIKSHAATNGEKDREMKAFQEAFLGPKLNTSLWY